MSDIQEAVKQRYGSIARQVRTKTKSSCCGPSVEECCSKELYSVDEVAGLPEDAVLASLGCGNPTLLAQLHEGEVVLDLGSGGGIDVLLSARRVGPTGKAYGVDMTDDMLELARENQRKSGLKNVEFLKGTIEELPLPDKTADVILSNCVINLSGDKPKVLSEAFRVLKPGGRFAVSDIVALAPLPESLRKDMLAWSACIGGALEVNEYKTLLAKSGFKDIDVQLQDSGVPEPLKRVISSAFIRARKPA